MAQLILGIKGTGEYIEASGNGSFENPYIPTVYVSNISGGTGGGTVTITGTLPSFTATPTFNIGTAPNLTFTNTSFIANAGTNLNTSLLALESEGNLAGINSKLPALVNGKIPVEASFNVSSSSSYLSSAIITRATNATAYTGNDVYGGVFELTNIGPNGGFIFLSSLDIIFNISSLPSGMGAFTVYLYSSSPPSAIADNQPFNISGSFSSGAMTLDRGVILSTNGFSLTAAVTRGGNTVAAELSNINQLFKLTTTSLWGYLVTNTGFTFTGSTNTETAVIRARSFTP